MPGPMVGLLDSIPAYRDMRGYSTGYDTQQTPFEVAKERGLAGVVGGTIDNLTMGATDFDKRGKSKKQEDAQKFLNKFIFGTQGDAARKTRDEMGGGDITSFSPGPRPELGEFNYSFDASERAKSADFMRSLMAAQANNAGLQQQRR